ncbi:MAG: D-glycerate dehydrogenase [Candidatus Thermoplasmatota archaeon]
MYNVFVTRKIPDEGIKLLERYAKVNVNPYDRPLTKEEIIKGIRDKDGLLCLLNDHIDREVITAGSKLRVIANYAVGYNNIDVNFATRQGIMVTNTPDVLTDTTAEMAWALLFAVARRIVEGDRFTREGRFTGWAPMLMLGLDVTGKTLGVIGAGRIGSAFALKSKGFNMRVLYTDQNINSLLENELKAERVDLMTLLRESDYISIHVPLMDTTYHLIGEKELRSMKKNAVLVNTSRGPVLDEQALIRALKERWITGAGLDVYEHEPFVPDELKNLDNVVLMPHAASATYETRRRMAVMAAENLIAGLRGVFPPNCVNPEVYTKKI